MKKRKIGIIVVGMYLVMTIVRIYIGRYMHHITFYPDEMLYHTFAYNFVHGKGMTIYGLPAGFYKYLYSLVIAPATLIPNDTYQSLAVTIINSLVMNAGVFPIYALSKDVLGEDHKYLSLIACGLYLLVPDITFTQGYMTEILFLPLSSLLMYSFYKLFDHKFHKYLSIGLGFGLALLNTNRSIALFMVLAYELLMIGYGIKTVCLAIYKRERDVICNELPVFCNALLMGFVFLCFYGLNAFLIDGGGVSSGVDRVVQSTSSLLYTGYALKMYFVGVLLAAGILPIVLPLIYQKYFNHQDRSFFFYVFLVMIVGIFVTVMKITLKEDFGIEMPRLHLRYLCNIWIPLIIMFMKMTILLSEKHIKDIKRLVVLVCVSVGYVFIFMFSYRGTMVKAVLDHPMLNITNHMWPELQMIIAVFIMGYLFLSIFEFVIEPKKMIIVFLCVFVPLEVYNNYYESKALKDLNAMKIGMNEDCQSLKTFLNKHTKRTILMITDETEDLQGAIDTYVIKDNFFTADQSDLYKKQSKKQIIFPHKIKMKNPYWIGEKQFRQVDYIVIRNVRNFEINQNDLNKIASFNYISIYQLHNNHQLPHLNRKLINKDKNKIIHLNGINDNLLDTETYFLSDFKQTYKKPFKSGKKKGYLIHGLSAMLEQGKYKITINYQADKDNLAKAWISSQNQPLQSSQQLLKDQHSCVFMLNAQENLYNFDINVESYGEGVLIHQVIIERL